MGNYYVDLIAKNDCNHFSHIHMELPLLPLETIIRKHSQWHWIRESGHLLLDPLPKAIQSHIHLQYMKDRDKYRAARQKPIKWQYAKVGLIDPLWKPTKSSLKKKAYGHRLLYDKGWHGGNRSKSKPPATHTEEEWAACGLCNMPDSQHHWIRECEHPATAAVRAIAMQKVEDILLELRQPTHKKTKVDPDLLNIAETLHQFACSAVHGEHLWLGVIYTNMIHHLQESGWDFPLSDSKTTPRANLWKKIVLKVITPLLDAAKEMWAINKETSRREKLLGDEVLTPEERRSRALRQRHLGDIRSWVQRIEHKVGSLRHANESSQNIDSTPTSELLRETPIAQPTTRRLTKNRTLPPPSKPPIRWKNTHIQDFFKLNRTNSTAMIRKNLTPDGRMPNTRTLWSGRWDDSIDLEWLPPKTTEDGISTEEDCTLDPLETVKLETENKETDVDRVASEQPNYNPYTDSNYNNNTNNILPHNNACIPDLFICNSSSSCRSSNNNLEADDATKRRGVG